MMHQSTPRSKLVSSSPGEFLNYHLGTTLNNVSSTMVTRITMTRSPYRFSRTNLTPLTCTYVQIHCRISIGETNRATKLSNTSISYINDFLFESLDRFDRYLASRDFHRYFRKSTSYLQTFCIVHTH